MPERRVVETIYRGKRHSGEWWIDGAVLHLETEFGSASRPLFGPKHIALPSDTAKGLLRDILRGQDPHPPLFDWGGG